MACRMLRLIGWTFPTKIAFHLQLADVLVELVDLSLLGFLLGPLIGGK